MGTGAPGERGSHAGQGRRPGQPGRSVWSQLAPWPRASFPKALPCFLRIPRAAAGLLLYFILLPGTQAELTYLRSSQHSEVPTRMAALPSLPTAELAPKGLAGGKEDLFSFLYLFNFLN